MCDCVSNTKLRSVQNSEQIKTTCVSTLEPFSGVRHSSGANHVNAQQHKSNKNKNCVQARSATMITHCIIPDERTGRAISSHSLLKTLRMSDVSNEQRTSENWGKQRIPSDLLTTCNKMYFDFEHGFLITTNKTVLPVKTAQRDTIEKAQIVQFQQKNVFRILIRD